MYYVGCLAMLRIARANSEYRHKESLRLASGEPPPFGKGGYAVSAARFTPRSRVADSFAAQRTEQPLPDLALSQVRLFGLQHGNFHS